VDPQSPTNKLGVAADYVHLSRSDCKKANFPKVKSSAVSKDGERFFTLVLSSNQEINRTLAQFNTLHSYLSYRYPKSNLPSEVPCRSWSNYLGSITEALNDKYVPETVQQYLGAANLQAKDTQTEDHVTSDPSAVDNGDSDTAEGNNENVPATKEDEYVTYIEAAISSYIASLYSVPEAWTCKNTIDFFSPGEYVDINNAVTSKDTLRQQISAETFLLQAVPRSMVELASQGVFELDIRVKTKREVIIWDFSVLEHDIAFTLYFEGCDGNTETIYKNGTLNVLDNDNVTGGSAKVVKKRKPKLFFFQPSSWGRKNGDDTSQASIQDIVDEKCSTTDKSSWLQVFPYTHYTSYECCPPISVQGHYFPARPGTCRLEWDNSFSMIRSKTLRYVVEVVASDAMEAATLAANDREKQQQQILEERQHDNEVSEAMEAGAGRNLNIKRDEVPTHLSSESLLVERLEKMEDLLANMTALRDQALARVQIEESKSKDTDTVLMETQRRLEEMENITKKQMNEIQDAKENCKKWESIAKTEVEHGEERLSKLQELQAQFEASENERVQLDIALKELQGEFTNLNVASLSSENETLKRAVENLTKDLKLQTEALKDERNENEKKDNEIIQLKASIQMLKGEMRSQKAIINGDALKYKSINQKLMDELLQYKTRESKLKAQKTLLVREVKSLRNKLSAATMKSDDTLPASSNQGADKNDNTDASNNTATEDDDLEPGVDIQARGWS